MICKQCNGSGVVSHMHYDGTEDIFECDQCEGEGEV